LYAFDIICFRFFTVFGPRQRPDLAIHKFTRLIDIGNPIPVFGDGTTARDYTYIEDIVEGIILSLDNIHGYQIYNLGESRVMKLSQLIQTIEGTLGKEANLHYLPKQPGDVDITYADITKARTQLGYNPKFNLESGIQRFVEWYQEFKDKLYP
jgi:UDP-glucuronate 4-epimerase